MHYETIEQIKSDGQETREWREGDKNKKNDEKTKKDPLRKKRKKNAFFLFSTQNSPRTTDLLKRSQGLTSGP